MEFLWTPWRYPYIAGLKADPERCVFCDLPAEQPEDDLLIAKGQFNYIVLNRYPYTTGHSLVVPFRHFAVFHELSAAEAHEMIQLSQALQRALEQIYHPEGFNLGWNQGRCAGAGVAGHLHLHMIPRWTGDSNLVSTIGETRILPEELSATRARLKPFFP